MQPQAATDKAPDPHIKAQCTAFDRRIKRALDDKERKALEKGVKKQRLYVRGKQEEDGEVGQVRVNLIYSTIATILPQVYAKDPDIAVTPTEAVSESQYPVIKRFCKTLEIVLRRQLVTDGKLKRRAKGAVRSAMTTSIGWVKIAYQRDYQQDPIIQQRIQDTQDNLQRIRYLISQVEQDSPECADHECKCAELQQQLDGLRAQAEVVSAEGLVMDRVLTEDVLILDDSIKDFDAYQQADEIAHRVWMSTEKYEQTFGAKPPQGVKLYGDTKDDAEGKKSNDSSSMQFVLVYEIWSRKANTVYTKAYGSEDYARQPYQPQRLGEQWYPFFPLGFNLVDGQFQPISDVELLIELQDEYNANRTQLKEHREESLPVRAYRKGGDLTEGDINNLVNRKSNDWIPIEGGDPNRPLTHDIAILENPPIDQGVYDASGILRDIEMVSGAQDASRGTVNKAKTATEAEIMMMGLQSRTGERQDAIEDWIADIAKYCAEILLQEMTEAQVARIAGPDYVWPRMAKDQIFDLVNIEIRAGSTGKPNKIKERDQWLQFLPQLQGALDKIAALRTQGQPDLAEANVKLIEETLRRFDERIDIAEFLPQQQGGANPLEGRIQQLEQVIQQLQGDKSMQLREQDRKDAETQIHAAEVGHKVGMDQASAMQPVMQ